MATDHDQIRIHNTLTHTFMWVEEMIAYFFNATRLYEIGYLERNLLKSYFIGWFSSVGQARNPESVSMRQEKESTGDG